MSGTAEPGLHRRWHLAVLIGLVFVLLWLMSARLVELPTQVNLAVKTKGAMVLSVFGGAEPETLEPSGFPEPIRRRLNTYLSRRAAFRSIIPEPARGTPAHEEWSRCVVIERAIVALLDVPDIADQAAAFASREPFGAPWTDTSEGPMAEAREAETFLEADPATPLKPYVWLFLMHRFKAALPLLRNEGTYEADIGSVTMRYARFRALAAGYADPLIGLIAADIDQVASVYPLVRSSGRKTPESFR